MWLANLLTLSRIPLAGAFYATYDRPAWSVGIVATAAATDALDGFCARRARARGATGTAGEWLDPMADKVFVLGALGAALSRTPAVWPLALLTCAREIALAPLVVAYRFAVPADQRAPHAFQADRLGKAATIAQLATVGMLVVRSRLALPFAVASGVLGLAAVAQYVRGALAHRATLRGAPR